MTITQNLEHVLAELSANQRKIKEEGLRALAEEIIQADHIFLAGAGRSGIAIQGFANRLMHLGKSVSLVGEISSPHSHPGDLLIVGSGSGETESLVALARKAKRNAVKICLITMDKNSTIGQLADVIVVLPGVSPKLKEEAATTSIQPMGSAFEQISFLTYDAIILDLMEQLGESSNTMFSRHADLE